LVQRLLPNKPRQNCATVSDVRPKKNLKLYAAVGKLVLLKMRFSSASIYLDSLQRLIPSVFKPQNTANVRFLVYGILFGFSFSLTATSFVLYYREKRQRDIASRLKPRPIELKRDKIVHGVTGLIGRPVYYLGLGVAYALTHYLRKHALDKDQLPERRFGCEHSRKGRGCG
jgi:hypothetical protein